MQTTFYILFLQFYTFFSASEQKSHFVHGKRPLLNPHPPNGHWLFCVMKVGMDVVPNIKIFIESKNTGGIWRQKMHLSIESAWKWNIAYKIASIGLRLDRPQLQRWFLF